MLWRRLALLRGGGSSAGRAAISNARLRGARIGRCHSGTSVSKAPRRGRERRGRDAERDEVLHDVTARAAVRSHGRVKVLRLQRLIVVTRRDEHLRAPAGCAAVPSACADCMSAPFPAGRKSAWPASEKKVPFHHHHEPRPARLDANLTGVGQRLEAPLQIAKELRPGFGGRTGLAELFEAGSWRRPAPSIASLARRGSCQRPCQALELSAELLVDRRGLVELHLPVVGRRRKLAQLRVPILRRGLPAASCCSRAWIRAASSFCFASASL